jgi:hypothetical protein
VFAIKSQAGLVVPPRLCGHRPCNAPLDAKKDETSMTMPAPPETIEHDTRTLFITDAEMIRRMGVPENLAYQAVHELDHNRLSGFPPKQKLWGNRRYWPAVVAWLDHLYGFNASARGTASRAR